jgi:hypothetical protein
METEGTDYSLTFLCSKCTDNPFGYASVGTTEFKHSNGGETTWPQDFGA